ncbi:hypothetical protein N431DRAFT_484470 [Stipitochalara longipes BDJ]|nr:hypothetical protein N431DRAFT_484470 [Stipitochalara longipes BDJ]
MSWAAYRQTSREEDRAYCLMGIFEVNMLLLYGEGDRAFFRLQEDIMKVSADETIFAWQLPIHWYFTRKATRGMVAISPDFFSDSASIFQEEAPVVGMPRAIPDPFPQVPTNRVCFHNQNILKPQTPTMSSFATPSPQKAQMSLTPKYRHKGASSWQVVRYSPYLLNPLIPKPISGISTPTPNPLYQPATLSTLSSSSAALPAKLVRLQLSFSLRQDGIYDHPFLVVGVKDLPAEPWPTFIADVPLWLTTTPSKVPFIRGVISRSFNICKIEGNILKYQNPDTNTIAEIFQLINGKGASVSAKIEHIRWNGLQFFALGETAPGIGWQNVLPRTINDFGVSYVWGTQATEEHARRMKFPTSDGQVEDDSRYPENDLRPGVMLGGLPPDGESRLITTSGVCVEAPDGTKSITVAKHGFPGPGIGQRVYQPMPRRVNGQVINQIGRISKVFGDEDIAVADLRPGIRYSRETFSEDNEPENPVRPFRNLKNPKDLKQGDTVFMNTPVNGLCEGAQITTNYKLLDGKNLLFEIANITYFGNGSGTFFNGCCGGVLWDAKFDVVGQFRFINDEDKLAYGPTFEALRLAGYGLSSI